MRDFIDDFWWWLEDVRVALGGEDPFMMANVGTETTGLPYMVWIGHRGRVYYPFDDSDASGSTS